MAEPVFAGIFAWWWLYERWNFLQLVGAVVVITGIVLADRARTTAR